MPVITYEIVSKEPIIDDVIKGIVTNETERIHGAEIPDQVEKKMPIKDMIQICYKKVSQNKFHLLITLPVCNFLIKRVMSNNLHKYFKMCNCEADIKEVK